MARSVIIGFESGSLSGEPILTNPGSNTIVGSVAIESAIVRTGSFSLKLTPASGANGYWDAQSGSAFSNGYLRFYVRVTVLPGTARRLMGQAGACELTLNTTGTITFKHSGGTLGTSTTALTDTAKWYRIEVKNIANSQELKIEGVSEVTATQVSASSIAIRFGADDTVAASYTAYIDDITRDSAVYPGEGQAKLLVPISDNARVGFTGGAGGTTSLFDAVNNLPPVGLVSASATNTSQIEHPGGAAGTTDNYDPNMTTYATAGIGSGDIINSVQAYIIHGEDVATGTKVLSFEVLSNPAVANSGNFNAGNDVGAVNTFPTNWLTTKLAPVDSPSVALGTSPVMRVIRPETATRVASVCFMGIYVDYTPTMKIPLIAHRRRWVSGLRN